MLKYQDISLIEGRPLWARRGYKRNEGLFSNKYVVDSRPEVSISGSETVRSGRR